MSLSAEKSKGAEAEAEARQKQLQALQARHAAAVELLGEREEALAELRADVADMKAVYCEQVDLLTKQLASADRA